jgi:hypothetical protein
MRRFSKSHDGTNDIDGLLWDAASRPRGEFSRAAVRALERHRRDPRLWGLSRVSFACAVLVFMLGTLASFGAASYAASGAKQAASVAKSALAADKAVTLVKKSAAQDEYPQERPARTTRVTPTPLSSTKASIRTQGGGLPFTGAGLAGTFLGSLLLVGAGMALRRASYARIANRRG